MTYLLTGVCGFIGSKVAEILLDDRHNVIGIDNMNDSYDVRLKEWRLSQIKKHRRFSFCKGDICNRNILKALFSGVDVNPDAVIHLAARAGIRASVEDPWVYFETNVTGTLNLLELCREYEVKKFILASSSSVYGENNPGSFREGANTDSPLSPYAASKMGAEALCYTYHHLYGIDMTVFRYFTVYGPAGRPDMSPFRFVQWIAEERPVTVFGDGTQSRDFTYIDDIVRGTIAGLEPLGYEVINLGSDTRVVLMDAIGLIEELVGIEALIEHQPRYPGDVQDTRADIGKARDLLGWQPEISFADGIQRLVTWYQANRDWAREIRT